ncbi:MAG: flagellar hook-associated protein FlgK [Thermodesulfobacteriota bacterium]
MSTLNSVLDIAKTALLSSQKAINVTSHNISNASTPGYTKQTAVMESMDPVNYGGLYFGAGVTVSGIERVYDSFQATQIRDANSSLSRYEAKGGHLSAVESLLNDFGGSGLSSRVDDFFNAFEDLAASPSTSAERSALLSSANVLADEFNRVGGAIKQNVSQINGRIEATVEKINTLGAQVAELNLQITTVEVAGTSANDLRDRRDNLLNELSKLADISTVEGKDGKTDVYISGSFLVAGVEVSPLSVVINPENPEVYNISSNGMVLNDRITGGSLKGDLEGSAYLQDILGRLDYLAASIVKDVNTLHRSGYGLDGSTGVDFFKAPSVYLQSSTRNTGGAVISAGSVTDLTLLTLDDYEVRFSGPASYTVVNTATNAVVTTGAYASGSPITFDGISFTITDNTGTPAMGDTFAVSVTKNASEYIGVDITNGNRIAASSSAATLPGDNTNAMALAALKDSASMDGQTFSEFYRAVVTGVGTAVAEAKSNLSAQGKVAEQLQLARESVSGVSLEEEAINLIKLQRAYEAAAKVMGTADKMFEALLNIR